MTKLFLRDQEVSIGIYTEGAKEPRVVIIKNGRHNKQQYTFLILAEGDVILDGDRGMFVLATGSKNITINIKDTKTKIAKHLQNDDIYFGGIDAVPEGREREVLEELIR